MTNLKPILNLRFAWPARWKGVVADRLCVVDAISVDAVPVALSDGTSRRTLRRRRRAGTGAALDINMVKLRRVLLKLRQCFENDVVLIRLRVKRAHLSLTKRIVKRRIDLVRRDIQTRRRRAIDGEVGADAVILLIGRDVRELRQGAKFRDDTTGPVVEFLRVGVFKRVLILRTTHAIVDRQILHRLKIKLNPGNLTQMLAQTRDNVPPPTRRVRQSASD